MIALSLEETFLQFLLDHEVIDEAAALAVLDRRRDKTPPLGRLALQKRMLNVRQVFLILSTKIDTGLRFGEQAIKLGYLDETQLENLLILQTRSRPGVCRLLGEMQFVETRTLDSLHRQFLESVAVGYI